MTQRNEFPTHDKTILADPDIDFEISPFTMNTGCTISDIEAPHQHDFYVIQYVRQGTGRHVIDFQSYDMAPGTLFLLSPGQIHFWEPTGAIDGSILVFTEDFFIAPPAHLADIHDLAFFHTFLQSPQLKLRPEDIGVFEELFGLISREFENQKDGYASALRAFLHVLLVNIQRTYTHTDQGEKSQAEPSLVRRFKHLVSENFGSERSIQFYANQLGTSISSLNNTIKTVTGNTPGGILRQHIIMEAKRLLANTEMTASEVGYHLKFDDPSYFGRFFRRETGTSISTFRNDVRQKYIVFHKPA
ncbi:MAG: AraC family transcriptional regulator [Desulfobacterales bacterium]|nr:AraC family transcriptional regulator [Desulfobacterales bacterium]